MRREGGGKDLHTHKTLMYPIPLELSSNKPSIEGVMTPFKTSLSMVQSQEKSESGEKCPHKFPKTKLVGILAW